MTHATQNLNVFGIGPKGWLGAVRFYVVALKVIGCSTILAASAFHHNLGNHLSDFVCSLRRAIFPVWMVCASHFSAPVGGHAFDRAKLSGAAPTLANLELLTALLARTLQQSFWLSWSKFLRALFGACVRYPSDVSVWSSKNLVAGCASKRCAASALNCPLELSHG